MRGGLRAIREAERRDRALQGRWQRIRRTHLVREPSRALAPRRSRFLPSPPAPSHIESLCHDDEDSFGLPTRRPLCGLRGRYATAGPDAGPTRVDSGRETLVRTETARGAQIYECRARGDASGTARAFVAPEADLFDERGSRGLANGLKRPEAVSRDGPLLAGSGCTRRSAVRPAKASGGFQARRSEARGPAVDPTPPFRSPDGTLEAVVGRP